MRRNHTIRLAFMLALSGLAFAPFPAAAQEPQKTHTVRPRDTLWDIAQTYLGDPFRWPEIYRRNTATIQDPNLIYPDQVIIISGDVAPTPGTPSETPVAGQPQQPGQEPRQGMTIFNPDRFRVVRGERESLVLRTRASAVRSGDYLRAPFMTAAAGFPDAGLVDASSSVNAVDITLSERPIQLHEHIYVHLPKGMPGERDQRFLTFRYGPAIEGEGKVVVPTGVVRLNGAATGGRAEAVLLTKFEDVYAGQGMIPLDTIGDRPGIFPTRVEFGARTKLVYIYLDPVLPGIGHHVIFAATDGLVPGDQITVQRDMGLDAKGVPLPPQDIAVAQVTRVTPQGTSAVIIDVTDGGLLKGQAARVTAKMP